MRRIVWLLTISLIFAGCSTSNEDPTNIELEVLRASLLEKELIIDELRDTIDDYTDTVELLKEDISIKQKTIDEGNVLRQHLLEGQPQELNLSSDKDNYYVIDGQNAFMLYNFIETNLKYEYESLYKISVSEESINEIELFRGSNILFYIDDYYSQVYIQDANQVVVMNYNGKYLYEQELMGGLLKKGDITQTMSTRESVVIEIPIEVEEILEEDTETTDESGTTDEASTEETSSSEEPNDDNITEEQTSTVEFDEILITHVYYLVTIEFDSERYLEGVYHISYNGAEYAIELISVPEDMKTPKNPYFLDGKLYYHSSDTDEVEVFELISPTDETL